MDNPSVKSVSSFADKLYRNVETKGVDPTFVKDWIRGTFIFHEHNIIDTANMLNDLKDYIVKIDVKDNPSYKGIHLNLKYNDIPVEIQLHTENSWKLKTESDLFYEKYRNFKDIENQLSPEKYEEYMKEKEVYKSKWSQLLEERDFKALRAEASSLKNSISSSRGSISQNATGDLVLDQEEPINSLNGNEVTSSNRPVGVNTNSFSLNQYSSFDDIIASNSGNINNGPPPSNSNLPSNDLIRREMDLSRKIRVGQGIHSSSKFIDNVNGQFESFVVKFVNSQYAIESVLNVLSKINLETQKSERITKGLYNEKNGILDDLINEFTKDVKSSKDKQLATENGLKDFYESLALYVELDRLNSANNNASKDRKTVFGRYLDINLRQYNKKTNIQSKIIYSKINGLKC